MWISAVVDCYLHLGVTIRLDGWLVGVKTFEVQASSQFTTDCMAFSTPGQHQVYMFLVSFQHFLVFCFLIHSYVSWTYLCHTV